MKRYDEKLLHTLLDKYENSLLYKGENRRSQSISFVIKKSTLPEYFDEASQAYSVIHMQFQALEDKGLIKLCWKNGKAGHILERCTLVVERADEIYKYLNRCPKSEKEKRLREICREYLGKHPILDRFLEELVRRLEQGEAIRQFADPDHPAELEKSCRLILQILNNREEIFLREFSILYCNDSKTAEKETGKAAGIVARFSGNEGLKELGEEQVLEEYNIYKNPSLLMVKGNGCFSIGGKSNRICLEALKDGIGLSGRDIGEVSWEEACVPKQIVTIENLTSFHRWQEAETLAVYLGGYHNRTKRSFLKRLYQAYPYAEYAHFGDLDCGGFHIWKDLCEKTGIPFQARYMDTETYLRFAEYGKKLTEHDRRELGRMLEDPFFRQQWELFEKMLDCGVKVEQECVR